MSRWRVLFALIFFCVSAHAEPLFRALLGPAITGITNRRVDNEMAKILKIDPLATVYVTRNEGKASCTGRFLTPTTLITAAHCVDRTNPGGGLNVDGVSSIRSFVADELPHDFGQNGLNEEQSAQLGRYDLAIVIFPEGTGEFLGIKSDTALSAWDSKEAGAWVEGYGLSDLQEPSTAGVRGWGTFDILDRKDGLLITGLGNVSSKLRLDKEKAGERVAALMGDSGGAVFNRRGEIVGVVSGMRPSVFEFVTARPTGELVKVRLPLGIENFLIDTASEESRRLFEKAIHCDEAPCAENFAGSGVTPSNDRSVKNGTTKEVDRGLFQHLVMKTGRYQSSVKGEPPVWLAFGYRGNEISVVSLKKQNKDTDFSGGEQFKCEKAVCRSVADETREMKLSSGGKFSLGKVGEAERVSYSFN